MFDRPGGTPPEPPEPSTEDWFLFAEITERLAQLVWVEQQLGDLYQGWASVEAHTGATILIATAGRHHQWHAEVLQECLATSLQLSDAAMPHAPTPGWVEGIALLGAIDLPEQTVTRLRAIVRDLDPWLSRETTTLLDLGRPVADAHLMRWLRFIEIDHHDDGGGFAELLDALQANTVSLQDRTLLATLNLRSPAPAPSPRS